MYNCTTFRFRRDQMLQACVLKLNPDNGKYPHNAMHVYAQNAYCDERNIFKLKLLPGKEYTKEQQIVKRMTALNLQISQCQQIHMKQAI